MKTRIGTLVTLGLVLAIVRIDGQAPPPGGGGTPSPGFDLSGYWTAAMHEDALERGAGPELADYGGFPINDAARLFALSYNASRLDLAAPSV